MVSDILKKNKNHVIIFFTILIFYIYRVYEYIFPTNYQQDDVAELRVVFVNDFFCALDSGDNHPLFTMFIWFTSRLIDRPEYIISLVLVFLTIVSMVILFNILKDQFTIEIALFFVVVLLFSPSIINYSLSLKQYSFELFATVYSLRFLQENLNSEAPLQNNKKFYIISCALVLFSFVCVIPILLTLFFIIVDSKKLNFKLIIWPIIALAPFSGYFIRKVGRVSGGGYWDNFFITNELSSIEDFYNNFYFLNSLFLKSLFVENLVPIIFIIYLLAIIWTFFSKEKILLCSLAGVSVVILLSILRLYPLGGGRTDILFLPYLLILISGFADFIYLNIRNKNIKYILIIFIFLYSFNGLSTTKVFYKNENIESIIFNMEDKFNSDDSIIIVSSEQYFSLLYYSQQLVNSVTYQNDECEKITPNIKNLIIYDKNKDFKNLFEKPFTNRNIIFEKNQIILIGIELPGTTGKYREVNDFIIDNKFALTSKTEYDNGLISLEYNSDE